MSALTLPGGLAVRECSPGVLLPHEGVPDRFVGCKCVVGRVVDVRASAMLVPLETVAIVPVEAIALDLSHETGLQHAIWWLIERTGLEDVQAIAEYGGNDTAGWVLQIRYSARAGSGLVRGSYDWKLDSKPESLAHAVHSACLKEAA